MIHQRPMRELPKLDQIRRAMKWWNNLPRPEQKTLKEQHKLGSATEIARYWLEKVVT